MKYFRFNMGYSSYSGLHYNTGGYMVFPSVSKSGIYSPIPVVPVTEVILVLQIIITNNNGAVRQYSILDL